MGLCLSTCWFMEVLSLQLSCHIVKLVLRNNALTTLRGIENLKSLQGLDVSYNIISNLLEMEILVGLSSLQFLWLEGNPLCCSRWYRAQVFSFFPSPEKVRYTFESFGYWYHLSVSFYVIRFSFCLSSAAEVA